MIAEIIAVGNEVVMGHTVNTNASMIAKQIQTIGIMPSYHSAVCDDKEAIKEALGTALNRAEVIFITGGLGPTKDDLTKEVVCEALGMPLHMREDVLQKLEAYFNEIEKPMCKNNEKQAAFPKEAYLLENDHGTAPGCILEKEKHFIVLLPGPPKEMIPMLINYVIPYFKNQMDTYYKTIDIKLFGIGESNMAEKIAHLLGEFEWGVVAPYIGNYEVIVRVTAKGITEEAASQRAEAVKKEICSCLEEYVIGYNEDKLEESVLALLRKEKYTVATVESCTGGMVAAQLVNCSGISACFKEGIVTYSNEAKMKYVDVKEETLKAYGAVSKETALEMAQGIRKKTGADIGLSTTGIAGPGGGTPTKPVGLVYIGLAIKEKTYTYELHLHGTRQTIRENTVKHILFQLYKHLK